MSALSHKLHQARYYLQHLFWAKRKGHGVHSPFVYKLCEEVFYNEHLFYDFENLNKIREQLLKDNSQLEITDLGVGSQHISKKTRRVRQIAKYGISVQRQSELIYLLINYFNCETSIELGTSLGLNTLYMASANKKGKVYSLEGAEALVKYAKTLATKNQSTNIEFIQGNFDTELPKLFEGLATFDLLYIDGNHSYAATLHYFKLALAKKNQNTLIIFDDIYWSADMSKAWEEIKQHPEVRLSLDLFYFGLVFFREEIIIKQNFRIFI